MGRLGYIVLFSWPIMLFFMLTRIAYCAFVKYLLCSKLSLLCFMIFYIQLHFTHLTNKDIKSALQRREFHIHNTVAKLESQPQKEFKGQDNQIGRFVDK